MGKRIYEVEVSKTLYVYAEDGVEACRIAEDMVGEECSAWESHEREVEDLCAVSDPDSLPWGDNDSESTIRQIMEAGDA